jgi:hypothetical protein
MPTALDNHIRSPRKLLRKVVWRGYSVASNERRPLMTPT